MLEHLKILLEKLKGKRVAFLGLARSNLPLINLFSKYKKKYHFNILALDNLKTKDDREIKKICDLGIEVRLGNNYLEKLDMDVIFRSPGVYFFSKDLNEAKKRNIKITSEVEEFFYIKPCKIIAITGSDGKTTTTTVISKILENSGFRVHLGGNIGNPLLDKVGSIEKDDIAVVELSSFQLISMKSSPDIAVFTNISPNHLDVHKDMREYIEAKKNILIHQKKESLAVLNTETDLEYNLSDCCKGKVLYFSLCDLSKKDDRSNNFSSSFEKANSLGDLNKSPKYEFLDIISHLKKSNEYIFKKLNPLKKEEIDDLFKKVINKKIDFSGGKKFCNTNGAVDFLGNIYFLKNGKPKFIIKSEDIKLKGRHNIKNCLAAICATYNLVSLEAIVKTLREFNGVEHRVEIIGTKNGVTYINDSIATTPTRTIKGALSLFREKIILIAGGYDKNIPFKELAKKIIEKVKVLVLMGKTAKKISSEVESLLLEKNTKNNLKIFFAKNMEEAVKTAKENATEGDKIVLSPACASFGLYKNFEERGNHFKEIVNLKN